LGFRTVRFRAGTGLAVSSRTTVALSAIRPPGHRQDHRLALALVDESTALERWTDQLLVGDFRLLARDEPSHRRLHLVHQIVGFLHMNEPARGDLGSGYDGLSRDQS
jgi:hypothetical protein